MVAPGIMVARKELQGKGLGLRGLENVLRSMDTENDSRGRQPGVALDEAIVPRMTECVFIFRSLSPCCCECRAEKRSRGPATMTMFGFRVGHIKLRSMFLKRI